MLTREKIMKSFLLDDGILFMTFPLKNGILNFHCLVRSFPNSVITRIMFSLIRRCAILEIRRFLVALMWRRDTSNRMRRLLPQARLQQP